MQEDALAIARREFDEKKGEVYALWVAFVEQKALVERQGASAKAIDALERGFYQPYEKATGELERIDGRYRALLESMASPHSVITAADSTQLLRDIKGAALGDRGSVDRLSDNTSGKSWTEGTDAGGGFLVSPVYLAGYLEALRASAPLLNRVSRFELSSGKQVLIAAEGNTVTVAHLAEGATKPDSTGSLNRLTVNIHKVAGTSTVSDELLDDSRGLISDLVSSQLAKQIGLTVDTAIISGTGTGQPVGIRNATGVVSTPVDNQTGAGLFNSIIKAFGRMRTNFLEPDSVVCHPRDLARVELALDTTGRFLFEGGLASALQPGVLVADANIPTNLGAGTNESVVIVGNFKAGGYAFERQAITVEASRDAAWQTDQTVFRGVFRYGFGVVRPTAFEVITGITP